MEVGIEGRLRDMEDMEFCMLPKAELPVEPPNAELLAGAVLMLPKALEAGKDGGGGELGAVLPQEFAADAPQFKEVFCAGAGAAEKAEAG